MKNKTPTRQELAKALKEKRERLGLSVREVAKEIAVSPATYSRIENGRSMYIETYWRALEWLKS